MKTLNPLGHECEFLGRFYLEFFINGRNEDRSFISILSEGIPVNCSPGSEFLVALDSNLQ